MADNYMNMIGTIDTSELFSADTQPLTIDESVCIFYFNYT